MHKMELDPLLRVLCTLPYSLDDVRLFAQHFVFFLKKETKNSRIVRFQENSGRFFGFVNENENVFDLLI